MRALIRTMSFFEQWAAEVVRQPALMFTLVVAPFLLLLAFGDGVRIGGPRPRTLIVQSPNAAYPIERLLEDLRQDVRIVGVSDSLPFAQRALELGDVDAVAVVPDDPNALIGSGQQAPIRVLIGEIDPVRRNFARSYLNDQIASLNQRAVAEALREAQGGVGNVTEATAVARGSLGELRAATNRQQSNAAIESLQASIAPLSTESAAGLAQGALLIPGLAAPEEVAGLREAVGDLEASIADLQQSSANNPSGRPADESIARVEDSLTAMEGLAGRAGHFDPAVLSAPFVLQLEEVPSPAPTFTAFYSPGVLALLVQHLAVTLAALTLARMRLLRILDVLRVAPVRSPEVILGNYLSHAVLSALASAALLGLLVIVLEVPVSGSYTMVALIIGLLIVASLGMGFLASQLSSTLQQAAQVAMLILLGSIFFGGFAFSLDRIDWPVRALSHALPATYAIRSLQDVMLRGSDPAPLDIGVLAALGFGLLAVNVTLFARSMRPTAGRKRTIDVGRPVEESAI
jgi:ABC-2 type transport system permease protein